MAKIGKLINLSEIFKTTNTDYVILYRGQFIIICYRFSRILDWIYPCKVWLTLMFTKPETGYINKQSLIRKANPSHLIYTEFLIVDLF